MIFMIDCIYEKPFFAGKVDDKGDKLFQISNSYLIFDSIWCNLSIVNCDFRA